MPVHTAIVSLKTKGDGDVHDLTDEVADAVAKSGFEAGTATVFVVGSTAAVTTIEYERGLVRDVNAVLERLVPQGDDYAHNHGGDSNGHAHVRASIVGPSVAVPFTDRGLATGTWQQIVLIDFDDRPRSREVVVQVVGG